MTNAQERAAKLQPLSLRANFSWTLVGNVVYAASQWGILVVLAKLGSPEMMGQFALGLAVTAPVIMFTNLELRAIQATDAERQFTFGDYLGLRLTMTAVALLVIAGIVAITDYRRETALVILAVGLMRAVEAVSDVFYGLLQQHERMDRTGKSMMIKGVLSLLLFSIGVYFSGSVLVGVVGMVGAMLLRLVFYDIPSGHLILEAMQKPTALPGAGRPRFVFDTMKELLILALPLGAVMMLYSLNTSIPRFVLERYYGEGELGIFASMAYLLTAGVMVISALGQSTSPRLAQHYANTQLCAFRELFFRLLGVGTFMGVIGVLVSMVAGQELLTLFYTAEYAENADVLVLIMISAGITYLTMFMGYSMTATRHLRIQLLLFAGTTATTTIASLVLIPDYGLQGAGLALIAGAAVRLIGSAVVMPQVLRSKQSARWMS